MDHVRELQGRLFAVAIVFVVFSAAAYPFFDHIVNFLLAPLGKEQELVYLTPGGAFSFIIQVCMYIGFVIALPVVIYNLYRFIMPAMNRLTLRTGIFYMVASFLLAIAGMVFAYYVSLPAALYFLTSFDLYHINPMLTIDSYFSFIMTYMIVGALLFQIPLVMLLINGATPLKPKSLMKHQGKIILGSFIIAAVVSPTPDALNQTLLASPMVVMYQVGIMLVWLRNRRRKAHSAGLTNLRPVALAPSVSPAVRPRTTQPSPPVMHTQPLAGDSVKKPIPIAHASSPSRTVDGFMRPRAISSRPLPHLQRPVPTVAERQIHVSKPVSNQPVVRRSLDGFVVGT